MKYNQNLLFQDTDSNPLTNKIKIKEICKQIPQFLQFDINHINESVGKYFPLMKKKNTEQKSMKLF